MRGNSGVEFCNYAGTTSIRSCAHFDRSYYPMFEDIGKVEESGVGSELQYFIEKEECMELLLELCRHQSAESFRVKYDDYNKILLKYLEQPLLLNSHIVDLVQPMNDALLVLTSNRVGKEVEDAVVQHYICKATYSLCRVVGHKYVLKHFPHEVNHLEECLTLLSKQDKLDHDNWETSYVLLLWLAALCLIPFDICSMDSSAGLSPVNGKSALVSNIVQTCKSCMQDTGPTREAASVCLSVLLTRPDMETAHLHEFMTWSISLLSSWSQLPPNERSNLSSQYFLILGDLHCVFQIYKLGHRFKLLPYGPLLLPHCLRLMEGNSQTSTRKLLTKLLQRIGMNFLPPRIAAWRYLRGNRSLNLVSAKSVEAPTVSAAIKSGRDEGSVEGVQEEGEDEEDVPDEMEDVVDKLLMSLQDKDTVVRWSAAKGIGRITMRLTQDLAGDVVDAVIEAFADSEADSSWHGGCLALAELSRRGLLLPDRLAVVMPLIERAIRFDVMRGQHSIGAHVRDAACYVCWAFSRAYSPAVMAPFIRALTTALLTTALFDREVNCRRAASAAYQETVGRQGDQNVPNGITIITIADYFSVGNRHNCFTTIAASVAVLDPQLNESLLVHLATSTVRHWDRDMRELAAKALASLVPLNVPAAMEHLARLTETCTAANLNLRHGSLLATAELLFALVAQGTVLPEPLVTSIIGIVASIDKGRLYSCKGSELMRAAVCFLIQSIARARIPLPVKVQVAYVDSLNEHLRQPHESVQFAARDSLREFLHTHFAAGDNPSERLQKLTVLKYLEGLLTSTNVSITRGYALALGVMPARLLLLPAGRLDQVLDCLQQCGSSSYRIGGEYDADTCCHCITALDEIAERLAPYTGAFTAEHAARCFAIFLQASEDYSVDKRGDTGSWSRMAAMRGMERLLYSCIRTQRPFDADTIRSTDAAPSAELGTIVSTSVGAAIVAKIVSRSDSQVVVEVSFPARSLGQSLYSQSPLQYMINPDTKHFIDSSVVSAGSSAAVVSLLHATCPQVLNVVFKQLAEKLDAVREVAGSVLLGLVEAFHNDKTNQQQEHQETPPPLLSFPDYEAVLMALNSGSERGDYSTINWSNPTQVYPIVCRVLESPVFFEPVLSGLVLSVGGLSETTAKCSTKALLAYCGRVIISTAAAVAINPSPSPSSSPMERLASTLVALLVANKKCDRVIVPTLKTAVMLLNEGVLDTLGTPFLAQFTSDLYTTLAAEARGSTNVAKLCAILDLVVRSLSLHLGRSRYVGLQTLLSMLTHKYPRVRKHCAEHLYIFFLSDSNTVAANCRQHCVDDDAAADEDPCAVCPFFASQQDLERALVLLSSCTWDACDADSRAKLFEARIELTEMAGFAEIAAAVKLTSAQEGRAPAATDGPDELDSYEALVRDAGY